MFTILLAQYVANRGGRRTPFSNLYSSRYFRARTDTLAFDQTIDCLNRADRCNQDAKPRLCCPCHDAHPIYRRQSEQGELARGSHVLGNRVAQRRSCLPSSVTPHVARCCTTPASRSKLPRPPN
jgi:hypothetical protein